MPAGPGLGPIYFAWSGPADPWDASMLREDEEIFALTISQVEGDFATLQIDVANPRIGLLAAGRNLWCWVSYGNNPLVLPMPIFRGRLIGVPENLQDEVVRLQFVAKPLDYQAQKTAVAQTMQVAPFWDPVWLQDKLDDPDTVLESRTQLWHIDRVTLQITASDIIEGEDGIVDVTAADHFYDGMTITYGQTPLRRVNMTATVTWDQTGSGTVDLTNELVTAFRNSGSPLSRPLISSMTADGLFGAWPAPGSGIGGGWSMGADSYVQKADWIKPAFYKKIYVDTDVFPVPPPLPPPPQAPAAGGGFQASPWSVPFGWNYPSIWAAASLLLPGGGPLKTFAVAFPVAALTVKFTADWAASRKRSEVVNFTLDADVQSIITDPGQDEDATVTLSSTAISLPIDPGGATPLFDSRSPIYFKTGRGTQSFEYLLLLARAKLLARARCVLIKFVASWDFVISWGISCRYSARLFDTRLPGGVAEGKITGYTLSYSSDAIAAEVTIGCTIGHGGQVQPAAGAPGFANGVFANGVQVLQGGQVAAVPGQVVYLDFDNFLVIDDDGLDLFNMTPGNVLTATPAVNLTTTANTLAGDPKLTALGSVAGLLAGSVYTISGPLMVGVLGPPTFTYDGSGAGTLSAAPQVAAIGTTVTITGQAHNGFTVSNGLADQAHLVDIAVRRRMMPDPVAAVKAAPTRVCVDLVSCDGGAFQTTFDQIVQPMAVPQTINLEAP